MWAPVYDTYVGEQNFNFTMAWGTQMTILNGDCKATYNWRPALYLQIGFKTV